jgi:hypothetical protein
VQQLLDHLRRFDPFAGPLGWAFAVAVLLALAMIGASFVRVRR